MKYTQTVAIAFESTMAAAAKARADGHHSQCMALMERAHLIGQGVFVWHWRTHWHMLSLALSQSNRHEVIGQLARLSLVPLGHLLQRLPLGNVGSTRMGAFDTAPLPDDIARLLDGHRTGDPQS
jgi:hypothetical protein